MAAIYQPGDRIFVNAKAGEFALQTRKLGRSRTGLDTGVASWLTHPDTPESKYPQVGSAIAGYPWMLVEDVDAELDPSGLILITADVKGLRDVVGGQTVYKLKKTVDCPIAMFTLPALVSDVKTRIVAPVPKPRVVLEYLTTVKPTLVGVSLATMNTDVTGTALPDFVVSFTPDPDEPQVKNYRTGWVLDDRQITDIAEGGKVWMVREFYSYYWVLSV